MSRSNGRGRPRQKRGESEREFNDRKAAWERDQLEARRNERDEGAESPLVKFARVWDSNWGSIDDHSTR